MFRTALVTMTVLMCAGQVARPDTENWIFQHNTQLTDPDHYHIVQQAGTIEIREGMSSEVFAFEARTGEWVDEEWVDDGPGDINLIDVVDYAGTFPITILPNIGNTYGAASVMEIRLAGTVIDPIPGVTATIEGMIISGNLASEGDVRCYAINEDITVDGSHGDGPDSTLFSLLSGSVTGDITIGTLVGHIEATSLKNVSLTNAGDHTGDITVNGDFVETITIGSGTSTMQGNISIAGDFMGNGSGGGGLIEIHGDMQGYFDFDENAYGRILIHGDLVNDLTIDGEFGTDGWGSYHPTIDIDGDFGDSGADVMSIGHDNGILDYGIRDGKILIHGDMRGFITIDDGFYEGEIYIYGSLTSNVTGPEIVVGAITYGGGSGDDKEIGIVIDYDGWHFADVWDEYARIEVDGTPYGPDDPAAHLWYITECRGDLNNSKTLTMADANLFRNELYDEYGYYDPNEYLANYPPLAQSLWWHGDANASGAIDEERGGFDENAIVHLSGQDCCVQDWSFCPADLDYDGDTDLSDLSELLSNYGMTSGAEYEDGDLNGDGDVDLGDLAELLSYFGNECDCSEGDAEGGGGGEDGGGYVDVSVVAYDTKGYSGGGFEGEVDHFVFDLKIEVSDPNSDDWVATGAALRTYNDATFRLSTSETTPDQYATFVAAPWTTVPGSATADLAGGYDPPNPSGKFTTTGINLGWYDTAESHDGPATVMRIVIDVSEVEGADVSEGFGSVYFGNKIGEDDILVGDLASGTYTAESAPDAESLSGSFWVKGE